jgi:hypothetical protein
MALRRIAESRNRQRGKDEVLQQFGTVYPVPIGLGENVRSASANALNPLLANTMALRDLYKKHHWQVSGATFYQLHLLFDKHYNEQVELMDELAERTSHSAVFRLRRRTMWPRRVRSSGRQRVANRCRGRSPDCSTRMNKFSSNPAGRRGRRARTAMTGPTI